MCRFVAAAVQLTFLGNKALNIRGMLKRKKLPGAQQSLNMMGPGGGMMEGMKNNMMFMFSNMLMIGWISYFFSGFVLGETRGAHAKLVWCVGMGLSSGLTVPCRATRPQSRCRSRSRIVSRTCFSVVSS